MTIAESRFLRACRNEAVDVTPVWFMRQAGRSLPEYRALRAKHDFWEICRQPELCAEVTLQPVRRLGVDAAILFADIMTPLIGIGLEIALVEHVGPVIQRPVRTREDLAAIRPLVPATDIPFVLESVRLLKRELGATTPLIGFAGAPFTLASYLIEGKGSKNFLHTKALMYHQPEVWHDLMARLAGVTAAYLQAQAAAGADALQLFDSWVGCLSPADYATFVRPYTRQVLQAVRKLGLPVIHFGVDTAMLLPQMKQDGGTVIGVDWHMPLGAARKALSTKLALQGNLDPAALLGPWDYVRGQTDQILEAAAGQTGHIFNVGHGIHPETPLATLIQLVEYIHTWGGAA